MSTKGRVANKYRRRRSVPESSESSSESDDSSTLSCLADDEANARDGSDACPGPEMLFLCFLLLGPSGWDAVDKCLPGRDAGSDFRRDPGSIIDGSVEE